MSLTQKVAILLTSLAAWSCATSKEIPPCATLYQVIINEGVEMQVVGCDRNGDGKLDLVGMSGIENALCPDGRYDRTNPGQCVLPENIWNDLQQGFDYCQKARKER